MPNHLTKGAPRFAGFEKEGLAPWSGESYSTGRGEILSKLFVLFRDCQ